jgi:YgiT-type zinc finger domain-containing protein
MTCPLCKMGDMKPGMTTVVLTKNEATVIFKNVPAIICDDCGEYYLDETTTRDVYDRAQAVFSSGQELAISTFAVA